MIVEKYKRSEIVEKGVEVLDCSHCRNSCESEYVYMLIFAANKNNGTGLFLCEDCANMLVDKLSEKIGKKENKEG